MSFNRQIEVFGNDFWIFYNKQSKKVQHKIDFGIQLLQELEYVPQKYLKALKGTDGLFELRIKVTSNIFRIFCFFDKGKFVILLNGFQKKTQKTPKQEIEKALKLKKEYYEQKK